MTERSLCSFLRCFVKFPEFQFCLLSYEYEKINAQLAGPLS